MRRLYVIPLLLALSCHKSVNMLQADQILQLTVLDQTGVPLGTTSVDADNYTMAEVEATVNSTVIDTTTVVNFSTDNGIFATGGTTYSAKINFQGNAFVYIKSKLPLPAHVQATVGGNYTQSI